ncbi:unnamed protein product [Parascedosporium putredinis]|uniref:Quinate transporter n=1 Tax=Parascedosporium putredinis TaxID=1442378 RepID=A0A9P1GY49_9PEZI|nr:unnamed protein product [Parascedosporium putredinis]CAI7989604.1 unnamed protein product [Parascedosporium putredinis]
MGLLTLKEDRPTPKEVYNWRVYACAAVASFASCLIGYESAFFGTTLALPSFTSEFKFSTYEPNDLALLKQNIVSVYQAGAFFGSLAAFVSSYYLGRRYSLVLFNAIFAVGCIMQLACTGDKGLGLIIGGRVLGGFGVGGCSNMTPIYISELSPPAVRGRLVGFYELGWQIGGLVGFWINYGINTTMAPSHSQWLIPFGVQLIPSGLLFIGCFFIPESPAGSCPRIPVDHPYMQEELALIDDDLERYHREVGAGFWKPFKALKDRAVQWRFLLGGLLFVFQNGSGINAINYYSPTVFRSIGIQGTNTSFLTTGIFGVVKTVLTFVWLLFLIDHAGRRIMLIVGSIGGSLCMWFIGALQRRHRRHLLLLPLDRLLHPLVERHPWVVNSEMFNQNTRSLGQANAAANNWFWNFIIARFTEQMFNAWGYGVYFFFASLMILSSIFVFFFIPETKSIPLERMDRLFAIKPTWRAHGVLMQELSQEEIRADSHSQSDKADVVEEEKQKAATTTQV